MSIGITINDTTVGILAYADDIVLLAESEKDLNLLLDCLNMWCQRNSMNINKDKSKVVHFRSASTNRTNSTFRCGDTVLEIVDCYNYLGILLTEHLDYNRMARAAASSASRSLGLLISKYKRIGGMQHKTFTKLYDSMVWSVMDYGAGIWGAYNMTCIEAVHNRAMRFFLGVRKYTPNAAVCGDMGWVPPVVRQWGAVSRLYMRIRNIDPGRLAYRVLQWSDQWAARRKRNQVFRIRQKFDSLGLSHFYNFTSCYASVFVTRKVQEKTFELFTDNWMKSVTQVNSRHGTGGNKLRTYATFKTFYGTEPYTLYDLQRSHRSALSIFRCGVAPLKIETGRFTNTPLTERTCYVCKEDVEDEKHVLLHCPQYQSYRSQLLSKCNFMCPDFDNYNDDQKLGFILSSPEMVFTAAKTCNYILSKRAKVLYK